MLCQLSYANLPECAASVAPYPFEIQNTTHSMSFPCGYSTVLRDPVGQGRHRHSYCTKALACEARTIVLPFLLPADKLVCCEAGTTRCFPLSRVPADKSAAHKTTFFPQHLLRSYATRFFQIALGYPGKLACLNEPSLARLCKLHRLGHVAMLILCVTPRCNTGHQTALDFIAKQFRG